MKIKSIKGVEQFRKDFNSKIETTIVTYQGNIHGIYLTGNDMKEIKLSTNK